jgi:Arc/MetJ-type ribon-helix-helix transcriptional regulator
LVKARAALRVSPDASLAEIVRDCVMPTTYTPGPEADAIVDQLLAKGLYSSPDDVVRAAIQLLWRHEVELADLMRRGEELTAGTSAPGEGVSGKAAERLVPREWRISIHRLRGSPRP